MTQHLADDETSDKGLGSAVHDVGLTFLDSEAFTRPEEFHAAAKVLRGQDLVHWVEAPLVNPLWLFTKHSDNMVVERHHQELLNEPRAILGSKEADDLRFDVGRSANMHVGLGFGVHFCLGARLAKMELQSLLGALIPRLESLGLAGEPELTKSLFVSGLKHLPIRYTLN